jgi:hypothetical protein
VKVTYRIEAEMPPAARVATVTRTQANVRVVMAKKMLPKKPMQSATTRTGKETNMMKAGISELARATTQDAASGATKGDAITAKGATDLTDITTFPAA